MPQVCSSRVPKAVKVQLNCVHVGVTVSHAQVRPFFAFQAGISGDLSTHVLASLRLVVISVR